GDVQPYVAFGLGLERAGHRVRLAAQPPFESFVRAYGLEFASVESDAEDWTKASGHHMAHPWWVTAALRNTRAVLERRLSDCVDACRDADVIVVSNYGTLLGYHVAEKLRVPLVRAYYAPIETALGRAPHAVATTAWLRARMNRAWHVVFRQAVWLAARSWVNAARRTVLELPPLPLRQFY